jgi:RNA polymerase sigma-70 factor, ECF subfamily
MVAERFGDRSSPLSAAGHEFDEEAALVARLRTGDRRAAEELATRSYRMIFRALVRLCGDSDTAADLTQETYRKAWQSLNSFQGNARFSSWLYRIAHNLFLNSIRTTRAFVAIDEALAVAGPELPADAALAASQAHRITRESVLELPEPLQYVITAHFWAELSVSEIAEAEGVTAAAIRKRMAKAFELMRNRMEGGSR